MNIWPWKKKREETPREKFDRLMERTRDDQKKVKDRVNILEETIRNLKPHEQ